MLATELTIFHFRRVTNIKFRLSVRFVPSTNSTTIDMNQTPK